jgi:chemotaxis signal transduction protein
MMEADVSSFAGVRGRLRALMEATETAGGLSAEETRSVLAARARHLSSPTEPTAMREDGLRVLVFRTADRWYAVDVAEVIAVDPLPVLRRLPPGAHPFTHVGSVDGEIVLFCDVGDLVGAASTARGPYTRAVLLGHGHAEFGLLASEVQDIRDVAGSELAAVPERSGAAGGGLVRGVLRPGIITLNGAALLADPRLSPGEATP